MSFLCDALSIFGHISRRHQIEKPNFLIALIAGKRWRFPVFGEEKFPPSRCLRVGGRKVAEHAYAHGVAVKIDKGRVRHGKSSDFPGRLAFAFVIAATSVCMKFQSYASSCCTHEIIFRAEICTASCLRRSLLPSTHYRRHPVSKRENLTSERVRRYRQRFCYKESEALKTD